ncbi:MAG: ankyrin repeat domain-containing protein [Pedosphaera sp.]|nr:ankyrin repeat domain-containing protein [Pedosphaera sp.]
MFFGMTSLHRAAMEGHKEIAELLIDNSADVNATTNRGTTPLDEAIFGNHSEIADLLRKHGGKTKKELIADDS